MRLLCLCGSPVKGGNTYQYIEKALDPIRESGLDIEIVQLAGKQVADCVHCNWCLKNKDSDRICTQKDDGEEILQKIKAADILAIASPVYYGRMSGRLASLLDRTRPFIFSKPHRGCMADKPGVALAVGWGRNAGSETTLLSIIWSFLVLEMIPVVHHDSGALYGGVGVSNPAMVHADRGDKHAVTSDVIGILSAQGALKRAVDLQQRIVRKASKS